jgi:N-acetylglucosaminyl-diphospho-decaprenol L-rhamnosyltransferase
VKLALVVPLWNQWEFSDFFLKSLEGAAPQGSYELILVDNGSTDATQKGLKAWAGRLKFRLIRNKKNLGCAPAWNQGVRAAMKLKAGWIGVLNNDLVLSPGCLTRVVARAEARGWDLVSPATREGALDYDFERYAGRYTRRSFGRDEEGWFGWCFFVRAGVFRKVGLFDEGFKLGIGEDEDFARRMRAAGMKLGITGSAFVHHFGSKSLEALRRDQGRSWEEANLKKLRARWGDPARRGPLAKLGGALNRAWQRLRWGHLLKE